LLDEPAVAALHERLGDDPLRDDADPQRVWSRISRSRAAIGTLLLNQSVVAGVGNIYRSELLYLLGIHPTRPGHDVNGDEFDRLWRLLVDLMQIGARYNRIIIADPADVGKPRARMKRDERLLVYKKKVCGRCGGPIECSMMAARKIYACGRCQC
jgi:endonuclease-8